MVARRLTTPKAKGSGAAAKSRRRDEPNGKRKGAGGGDGPSPSDREAAKVADDVNIQLRNAGFPETAISSWWRLLIDKDANKTPRRIWDSGDYDTLWVIVNKTLQQKPAYRAALEKVTSMHFAERLAASQEVQDRLLGFKR